MVTYNSLICIHMENFRYKIHSCLLSQSWVSPNRGQAVFAATVEFITGGSLPKLKNAPPLLVSEMPSGHPITPSHCIGVRTSQHRGRQPVQSDPFPPSSVMSRHQVNLRHLRPVPVSGCLRAFPPTFPSRTLYPPFSICPLPGWCALKLTAAVLLWPLPWWTRHA